MASTESFVVRQITSLEEAKYMVCEVALKEGWTPGIGDHKAFFAADPSGFFIGELNGKKISCICAVKYGEEFAFIGLYIVDKAYRGMGYGLKTFQAAMASVKNYNVGLDAVVDMVSIYERSGFHSVWLMRRYEFAAAQVAQALSECKCPSGVVIKPAAEVDFEKLFVYDRDIFGGPRHSFLEKWINNPTAHALAATNDKGEVHGYIVIRKVIETEKGSKIGPLFADNGEVARSLLRLACETVAAENLSEKFSIDTVGANPDASELIEKELLGGKFIYACKRMYTKGTPHKTLHKIYSTTTPELG